MGGKEKIRGRHYYARKLGVKVAGFYYYTTTTTTTTITTTSTTTTTAAAAAAAAAAVTQAFCRRPLAPQARFHPHASLVGNVLDRWH